VQCAVEDEEELVGVVVGVPRMIDLDLRDASVVVIDAGDDARRCSLAIPSCSRSSSFLWLPL
jgi:hypothetical protein